MINILQQFGFFFSKCIAWLSAEFSKENELKSSRETFPIITSFCAIMLNVVTRGDKGHFITKQVLLWTEGFANAQWISLKKQTVYQSDVQCMGEEQMDPKFWLILFIMHYSVIDKWKFRGRPTVSAAILHGVNSKKDHSRENSNILLTSWFRHYN